MIREFRLIEKAVQNFKLDLKNITVLTEAASGNYVWTPIIAAYAGADVYAFSRDSQYSSFLKVKRLTNGLAEKAKLKNKIKIISNLTPEIIGKADIITNLGFLRPLNQIKLQFVKRTAVIPLMWETWEFRDDDLDLKYCYDQQIPVLGTNESHKYLRTLEYVGLVIKKLLFESGIEIFSSLIGIAGKGKFSETIKTSLLKDGARYCQFSDFSSDREKILTAQCDAIVFADYECKTPYFGKKSKISGRELKKLNPDIKIINLCGKLDINDLQKNGISYNPNKEVQLKHMSVSTDYVGPKPLIELHTAGLKVGELMSKARLKGLSYKDSIKEALENNICQDFSFEQKKLLQ